MNEEVHIRLSGGSGLPVCWTKNGPLAVDNLTGIKEESTCSDCIALQQAFQEFEDTASELLLDQARINKILGEL